MVGATKPRAIGFNHVALEVGDIEEALAFDGRHLRLSIAQQEQDDGLHRSWRPIHRVADANSPPRVPAQLEAEAVAL